MQHCDRQRIFDKTAYAQSQDIIPALLLYTNSARDAHDIFHVCRAPQVLFGISSADMRQKQADTCPIYLGYSISFTDLKSPIK